MSGLVEGGKRRQDYPICVQDNVQELQKTSTATAQAMKEKGQQQLYCYYACSLLLKAELLPTQKKILNSYE